MEYAPSGPHELRKARGSMGRRLSHADKEENMEEEDTGKKQAHMEASGRTFGRSDELREWTGWAGRHVGVPHVV